MRIAAAILFVLILSFVPVGAQTAAPQGASASQTALPQRSDDVQALRTDIQRMKAIVEQMQANLAFVDTTQSPLKHQFDLEIQMWRTVIAQMERRLDAMSPH